MRLKNVVSLRYIREDTEKGYKWLLLRGIGDDSIRKVFVVFNRK